MASTDHDYIGIASQFTRVEYFAKDQIREMARLLKKRCKSVDSARRCAAHFLGQDTPQAPTDFEVKDWVYRNMETADDNQRLTVLQAGEFCPTCQNSGKREVIIRRKNPITKVPTDYTAIDFCTCEIGKILQRL